MLALHLYKFRNLWGNWSDEKRKAAYKALYYGCFGCAPALRWKRYLPGNYMSQVVFAKINGKCLIYHTIPKAANTTAKSLLLDAIGCPVPSESTVHLVLRTTFKHKPVSSDNYLMLSETNRRHFPRPLIPPAPEFDHAFHFTFVRNPWARLASCYAWKVFAKIPNRLIEFRYRYPGIRFERMTFTDFVRFVCRVPDDLCDRHFASQCCLLGGSTLDFIGRTEHFAADLSELIRLTGLDERLLKWAHMKRHRSRVQPPGISTTGDGQPPPPHYTDLYTTQTRNLVARKYAKDIDRFGYRFGD